MGIYDRDYLRQQQPGFHLGGGGGMTLTTKIVLVTFAIYLVQIVTLQTDDFGRTVGSGWFTDFFVNHADSIFQPWLYFEFLTSGFLHAPTDMWHIARNMLIFWFLARDIERLYGAKEFLMFYLTSIIFSSIIWSLVHVLRGHSDYTALGASGGVTAIIVLYAFLWPKREILLYFIIPVPIWLLATGAILFDMYGAMSQKGNVGYEAHLGGALFAACYHQFGWRLSKFLPGGSILKRRRKGPKLRVHREESAASEVDEKVDALLRKIREKGQESLTPKERKFLEDASRDYQKRNE